MQTKFRISFLMVHIRFSILCLFLLFGFPPLFTVKSSMILCQFFPPLGGVNPLAISFVTVICASQSAISSVVVYLVALLSLCVEDFGFDILSEKNFGISQRTKEISDDKKCESWRLKVYKKDYYYIVKFRLNRKSRCNTSTVIFWGLSADGSQSAGLRCCEIWAKWDIMIVFVAHRPKPNKISAPASRLESVVVSCSLLGSA